MIYSYQSERRFIILNNEKLDVCELLKVIHEEDEWEDVIPEEIDSVLTAQDLSSALEGMQTLMIALLWWSPRPTYQPMHPPGHQIA